MIRKARDIMIKNFMLVNLVDSITLINNIILDKGIHYFPVVKNGNIVGIITDEELIKANPEDIAANVMMGTFLYVNSEATIGDIKEIFKKENPDFLLVKNKNKIEGLITEDLLIANSDL